MEKARAESEQKRIEAARPDAAKIAAFAEELQRLLARAPDLKTGDAIKFKLSVVRKIDKIIAACQSFATNAG